VEPNERAVRELYDARARGDWTAVGDLQTDDVAWHEPGDESYSGTHRGPAAVLDLLRGLVYATGGTFRLVPEAVLVSAEHAAALVRWSADRDGLRSAGNEIAVYRIRDGAIAEAWFYPDGYEPGTLAVFDPAR